MPRNYIGESPSFRWHISGRKALSALVQGYQREVVALIRGSGARLSILTDHRLVDLWREYSARQYRGGWIDADREEVFRFITWSNGQKGVSQEILAALREKARDHKRITAHDHTVRGWDGKLLVEKRLGRRRWNA